MARTNGDVICAAAPSSSPAPPWLAAVGVEGATWGTLAADATVAAATRVASAAHALTALGNAYMLRVCSGECCALSVESRR